MSLTEPKTAMGQCLSQSLRQPWDNVSHRALYSHGTVYLTETKTAMGQCLSQSQSQPRGSVFHGAGASLEAVSLTEPEPATDSVSL